MSAASRVVTAVLGLAFAAYLGWALIHSATDIPTYNDFEVFHYVGEVAAQRQPVIYELKTPHQQRGPFIYPVSASILFIPLSWLEHDFAGVLFSIVKVACLALLWWGGARFSGTPPRDAIGYLLVMLGPAIMLHRPVASDVGNGQINIIVAAAAVGGIWLIMLARRWWWLGSLLLAGAVAVKMTPALLLAVPLLHRRWKALALTAGFTVVLMVVLPIAWFGMDNFQKMNRQYRDIAARFTMDWPAPEEQTTLMEMAQFTRLQTGAAETGAADAPEILPVPISGYAGETLFEPAYRPPAMFMWLAIGMVVGAGYLLLHVLIRRRAQCQSRLSGNRAECGERADWMWDLAMLCALIVLLSPRAQKAHLVILIIPAAWLAARICDWLAPEASIHTRRCAVRWLAVYCVICAMFIAGENLAIPIPGFDEAAHALPLLGTLSMIGMLIGIGWRTAREASRQSIVSA